MWCFSLWLNILFGTRARNINSRVLHEKSDFQYGRSFFFSTQTSTFLYESGILLWKNSIFPFLFRAAEYDSLFEKYRSSFYYSITRDVEKIIIIIKLQSMIVDYEFLEKWIRKFYPPIKWNILLYPIKQHYIFYAEIVILFRNGIFNIHDRKILERIERACVLDSLIMQKKKARICVFSGIGLVY